MPKFLYKCLREIEDIFETVITRLSEAQMDYRMFTTRKTIGMIKSCDTVPF